MKETLFYSLNITSNLSTTDYLSRLMGDERSRHLIEQEIAKVLRATLDTILDRRSNSKAGVEVEILPLRESRSVLGPPP